MSNVFKLLKSENTPSLMRTNRRLTKHLKHTLFVYSDYWITSNQVPTELSSEQYVCGSFTAENHELIKTANGTQEVPRIKHSDWAYFKFAGVCEIKHVASRWERKLESSAVETTRIARSYVCSPSESTLQIVK